MENFNQIFSKSHDSRIKYKYHWSNNSKLKKDLKKIDKIYEDLLLFLYKRLNLLHNVDLPKRYWEILLWRWLSRYIIYYFDRWEIISEIIKTDKKKNFLKFKNFDKKKFVPIDTGDWSTRCVMSDDWNHWLYGEMIKFKFGNEIRYSSKSNIKPYPKYIPQKMNINFLKKSMSIFRPIFNKNIISQNLGFSKKAPLSFKIFLNVMHHIDNSFFSNFNTKPNFVMRNQLVNKFKNNNGKFEKFLFNQIKYNIPIIFLENYKNALKKLEKLKFPQKPKLIITALDDQFNEPFKFYLANNIISGTKFYHLQHGGSYGTSDDYPIEKFQLRLSDKFFTWGWKNKQKKLIPLYCQKTIGVKINRSENTKGLIIPIFEWNLHPGDIQGGRPRNLDDVNLYVKNLIIFYSSLKPKIRRLSDFKYINYKGHYPNYIKKILMKNFGKKNFFFSTNNTFSYLKKYKLNIETVNSTGFLETFNLNLPTILIFEDQFCKIRKSAKKFFKLLKEANILFDNPKSAAIFINKNYSNIDEWWNSKKVQNAVKIFSYNYARTTNNPYTFFKFINKFTNDEKNIF